MSRQHPSESLRFSPMFFAATEDALEGDRYGLVVSCARFADEHGFHALWVPERHFTEFGCLYPNPAVLQAALARETKTLRLHAGSVVVPLHNPLRIAEEWSMVDNLSDGRVGFAAAPGWNPNDFAFFPERYADRREWLENGLDIVRALWRGESIEIINGVGAPQQVKIHPVPVQPELPLWITAAGNPSTFLRAGELGLNVLTHLLDHDFEDIAERIALYRLARARHGHDPDGGQVTMMLHTFVGENLEEVREKARGPYCRWLLANASLLQGLAANRGQDIDIAALSEQDRVQFANFLFERFFSTRSLMGTPESLFEVVKRLQGIGVTEIACLLDFGPGKREILAHLPHLERLKNLYQASGVAPDDEARSAAEARAVTYLERLEKPASEADSDANIDDFASIRQRCSESIEGQEFYDNLAARGAHFATRFRGVERLWRRDGEALAEVRLPEGLGDDAGRSRFHPAFLDACLQVFGAALPASLAEQSEGEFFLPVGLGTFRQDALIGRRVVSHARLAPGTGSDGRFVGEIAIRDEAGAMLASIRGFCLERTQMLGPEADRDRLEQWIYHPSWQPTDAPSLRADHGQPASWWIFADASGVGEALAARLEARGDVPVIIHRQIERGDREPGAAVQRTRAKWQVDPSRWQGFEQLVTALRASDRPPCRGAVYLWSLDVAAVEQTSSVSIERDQRLVLGGAMHLARALSKPSAGAPAVPAWMVTRGACAVSVLQSPLQSLLWGLGTTWSTEQAESWGGAIDLDPQDDAAICAEQLLRTLDAAVSDETPSNELPFDGKHLSQARGRARETQLAWRDGVLHRHRLQRHPGADLQTLPRNRLRGGTYLITGGFGGIGQQVAGWLCDQGIEHLLLVGREVPPVRDSWSDVVAGSRVAMQIETVKVLEAQGAKVHYLAVDVADPKQVAGCLAVVEELGWPAIRGVMHTAGIGDVEKLEKTRLDEVERVLRPKVMGGWALHQAFDGVELDLFVLFSSATHQLGLLGQGVAAYSAANAFLDALAQYRRAAGLSGLSIDWGPWDEVGMAADSGNLQRLAGFGVGGVVPERGMRAMAHLLATDEVQAWIISIDWTQLLIADPSLAEVAFFAELVEEAGPAESDEKRAEREALLQALGQMPPAARSERLDAHIRQLVVQVMGLESASDVDWRRGLFDLGMDSLMALELKNRLQSSLGHPIPPTLAFDYPSVDLIAGFLAGEMFPEAPTVTENEASAAASVNRSEAEPKVDESIQAELRETAEQIGELDAEAMEALLLSKLEQLSELSEALD